MVRPVPAPDAEGGAARRAGAEDPAPGAEVPDPGGAVPAPGAEDPDPGGAARAAGQAADHGGSGEPSPAPPVATVQAGSPAATGVGDGEDRVLTAANVVTTLRLAGVGVFVWLLFGAGDQTTAAVLLAVLGATDWVDGQLARRLHQVSRIGKVLDPAVDRVLVGTAVIAVIVHGAVPLWFGVLTVAREGLVSGTVLVLAALGARRIDVLWVGKAGTFALMVAYPGFLISHGDAGWQQPFHVAAWVAGSAGIVLAWVAAIAYLVPARRALVEGREGREAREARVGRVARETRNACDAEDGDTAAQAGFREPGEVGA